MCGCGARGDELPVDPAEARAGRPAGGGGHHAALPRRHDGDLRAPAVVLEHDHLDVLPEEREVLLERALGGRGWRGHRGRQDEDGRET